MRRRSTSTTSGRSRPAHAGDDVAVRRGVVDAADDHGCLFADAPCNTSDSDNPADEGFNIIKSKDDDTAIKVSIQYSPNEDIMFYGLFSEGF